MLTAFINLKIVTLEFSFLYGYSGGDKNKRKTSHLICTSTESSFSDKYRFSSNEILFHQTTYEITVQAF